MVFGRAATARHLHDASVNMLRWNYKCVPKILKENSAQSLLHLPVSVSILRKEMIVHWLYNGRSPYDSRILVLEHRNAKCMNSLTEMCTCTMTSTGSSGDIALSKAFTMKEGRAHDRKCTNVHTTSATWSTNLVSKFSIGMGCKWFIHDNESDDVITFFFSFCIRIPLDGFFTKTS